jgi:hypothetical protein
MVLILRASTRYFLTRPSATDCYQIELGWAQNWAQSSEVHPYSETVFLGTLAVV